MRMAVIRPTTPCLTLLLALLIVSDDVTAFSVGSRKTRSADDLANALSILQRQRRRIGENDYYESERLLDGRPIGIDTLSDWLSGPDSAESIDDEWISNPENYEELDRDRYLYDFPPLTPPDSPNKPYKIQASKTELDDIFDDSDAKSDLDEIFSDEEKPLNPVKKSSPVIASKKNKEEALNVGSGNASDKKVVVSKKSVPNTLGASLSDNSDSIPLDSLTKEELNALLKAVEKLQKRAQTPSSSESNSAVPGEVKVKETIVRDTPEGRVVESDVTILPAMSEELDGVFGEEAGPASSLAGAEVDIEQESGPHGTVSKTVEKQLLPEPGDDAALEMESELLTDLEDQLLEKENEAVAQEAEIVQDIAERLEEQVEKDKEEDELDEEEDEEDEDEVSEHSMRPKQILDPKLIEALQDKYWLVNKYLDDHKSPSKRSTKRSALFDSQPESNVFPMNTLDTDDVIGDVTEEPDVLERLKSGSVPSVKAFVMKILALQAEVDELRVMSRLEDLENDQLTDALNMATQAQADGSVTDKEFGALQKAIQIEEAIQVQHAPAD